MESPCCSICIQRLEDKSKWRLSDSHKLLGDNCAAIKYVVKDVRGVRLGRKETEMKVRVRWEDTWEKSDWVDTRNQVKRIVKRSPGLIRIRWKDTWEPLEYLDDGMLREKAIMLLEEKFGL
ncbi:hypothetical protein FAGAP_10746 [Fusarium agapanthi]|uniref:Uncharacterized protein n=1 Tax=Fusarium agapanthi TaxID=1803897 RepID=A0A9P5B144_9HYPO|nr:hypothetical protein FAGAP_10746 [Fusarium agapanthi]